MNSLPQRRNKKAGRTPTDKRTVRANLAPTLWFLSTAYSDLDSQRVRKMFLAFETKPEIFGDTTSLDTYQ